MQTAPSRSSTRTARHPFARAVPFRRGKKPSSLRPHHLEPAAATPAPLPSGHPLKTPANPRTSQRPLNEGDNRARAGTAGPGPPPDAGVAAPPTGGALRCSRREWIADRLLPGSQAAPASPPPGLCGQIPAREAVGPSCATPWGSAPPSRRRGPRSLPSAVGGPASASGTDRADTRAMSRFPPRCSDVSRGTTDRLSRKAAQTGSGREGRRLGQCFRNDP